MTTVTSILGGEKELRQKVHRPIDFDKLIKLGLPSNVLSYIKDKFNLSDEHIAQITGVSPRTVARRRKATWVNPDMIERRRKASSVHKIERLSPIESDRIDRFARIIALAEDVFEDKEEALEWLNVPQQGLGGAIPFAMLQTDAGTREVEQLLIRIDYGVIS
jgi:putative toxin-antitoxin system antitoxin component (TIGR02293 family)